MGVLVKTLSPISQEKFHSVKFSIPKGEQFLVPQTKNCFVRRAERVHFESIIVKTVRL
jgi:hypothetical protein